MRWKSRGEMSVVERKMFWAACEGALLHELPAKEHNHLTPPGDYAVFEQLRRVIAWEVEAQAGVDRPMRDMPSLIADTLLDYFVVTLKADVDLP